MTLTTEKELIEYSLAELEFPAVLSIISSYCLSENGKEIILSARPADNSEWLRKELTLVEEMRLLELRGEHLPIESMEDIRNSLQKSKIEGACLSPTELLTVHDVARSARLLKSFFRDKTEEYPSLSEQTGRLHENRFFEKHIADAIDDSGMVRDSASKELMEIRRDIAETQAKLRSRLQKILQRISEEDYAMDEYVTQREGRFVLPIKAEAKRIIPGIIHGVSQTGSTVFMEPSEIFDLNNQLSLLLNDEQREIFRILSTLTGELGAEAHLFMAMADIMAHIDSLIGKSRYAIARGGIAPKITDENYIELRSATHPLLPYSPNKKPTPLTIEFTDNGRGHLISGPNAGGKTVALKNIGLNIAMAISGIFPLGECTTNIRSIFTAIGDHQSIEQNLSTFSSQIVRLREIMSHCSPQALILIDEICSGTDPQEGGALAAGILDSIIARTAFFVVTTHQSSLKTYALSRPEIQNASMEFDQKALIPTYRFLSGVPGNSYAFVLAKSVGIPEYIIDHAKNYLGDRHSETEKSIAALQQFKQEAEAHAQAAAAERIHMEKARRDYEKKFNEFREKYQQLIVAAKREAEQIVGSANALVENTIREIREQQRPVGEIRKEFEEKKQAAIKRSQEAKKEVDDKDKPTFSAGDSVSMGSAPEIGVIIEIDPDQRSATVEFNGLKFKIPLSQLRRASRAKMREYSRKTPSASVDSGTSFVKLDARASADVRGFRADEACKEVERLISDAVLGNLPLVSIIHGKGTGALRSAIHEQLRFHQSVKEFRIGAITEGGDGVTIVELR